MDSPQDAAIQQLTLNVSMEWRHQKQLLIYHFDRISKREEADQVRQHIDNNFNAWPSEQPYRVLYYFRVISWSPYLRQNAEKDFEMIPKDREAWMAVVIPRSPLSQIIRLFMRAQAKKAPFNMKIFWELDEALTWIGQGMTPANEPEAPPDVKVEPKS